MTKKCTIFSGGEAVSAQCVAEYKSFIDDSLVISADKGYKLAQAVGVKSDIIMGDFDSAEKPVFDNIEIFPSEKDDTDLMLAIKQGFESGCDDFLIFGATGGRADHLLGNIQSLGYILSCGGEGMIAADSEIIRLYRAGSYRIYDREGFSFSLVAYTDKVESLTIKGAKYEVEDCLLTNASPLGISNVVKGFDGQDRKYAEISFKSGYLLSVQSKMVTDF